MAERQIDQLTGKKKIEETLILQLKMFVFSYVYPVAKSSKSKHQQTGMSDREIMLQSE